VVQIVHGMSEHAARYRELGERLVASGYAAYAHDQRGHGRSVPPGEEPGHIADEDGFDRAVADVRCVSQRVAVEHPAAARVLLGHSLGSFLVQRLLYEHPDEMAAAVLSASNGRPPPIAALGRVVARLERARLGRRGRSKLLDALSFGDFNRHFRPNRTGFDWLSRDQIEVDAYVADPLCGLLCSTQCWIDLLDALPKLTRPANLARIPKALPIYAFAGDRDPVGDMGRGVLRLVDAYRRAWLTDVTHRLYPGGRHEMLHETNRHEVMNDLVGWLDRVFPA
jgi:alpha-beta hydrolase superfamily lysophospholipase